MQSALASLATSSGGRVAYEGLPRQTDKDESSISANQCSWAAHEFVLCGVALESAVRAGDEAGFRATYAGALRRGSENRRDRGDARLSMGENLDNAAVRACAAAAPAASSMDLGGAAHVAVGDGAKLGQLRAMAAVLGPLSGLALQQVDPERAGVTKSTLAAFREGLAGLPPLGFALVCRNGKSLALLRMAEGPPDDKLAFLILDSHCSETALVPLAAAAAYAVEEGGGTVPELTWILGRCIKAP